MASVYAVIKAICLGLFSCVNFDPAKKKPSNALTNGFAKAFWYGIFSRKAFRVSGDNLINHVCSNVPVAADDLRNNSVMYDSVEVHKRLAFNGHR